jgi:N-acetylmuramic acid 6-phosphate etherase
MADDQDLPPVEGESLRLLMTEQANPATAELDRMDPLAIVRAMNAEDAGVAAAVARELPRVAAAVEAIAARLRRGGRLVYVGAGTSGRLAALDALECPPTFCVPPDRVLARVAGGAAAWEQDAERLEDSAAAGEADLGGLGVAAADAVVGVSASGRTPYVLGAVALARRAGTLTVGLACNADSALARGVDIMIAPLVGPEVIAGSTRLKAGTAQKMVLNMLSTGAMVLLGKTYGNLMVDVRATNHKLRERALAIVRQATGLPREAAAVALDAAGGEVKTAILAARADIAVAQARARLDRYGGSLRTALEARS